MRARLRPALLSLLVIAGAFALGGCSEEKLDEGGSTLIIDDDRALGAAVVPVFYTLGTGTPVSTTIGGGQSKSFIVASGTYTVTFDDDGVAGVSGGDTVKTGVQVGTGQVTTVEYAGEDKANVIGPNLQANG